MIQERLLAVIRYSPLGGSRPSPRDGSGSCAATAVERLDGLDPVWYFQTYRNRWPDFLLLPDDAVAHYHLNARHFSLSPNLAFDEFWYRRRYTDVESLVRSGAVATGWHHYLEAGCIERRNPTWWFDERWYVSKNIEASQALQSGQFACGFEHYLLYGMKNNLSPSLYFDTNWYRNRYLATDDRTADLPVLDYLRSPSRDQRCPVPFFNSDWYRAVYLNTEESRPSPDEGQVKSAYEHYIYIGRFRQYSPSPGFDERAYRELNPPVAQAIEDGCYLTGFEHYISEGVFAGLSAPTHLATAGMDYAGPSFVGSYEKSLRLNFTQLRTLRLSI